MKYTLFGFSQQGAVDNGLDLVDMAVLRWIVDFWPSMGKREIDGQSMAWVNYQALLDDMPILSIQKRQLMRTLKRLVAVGILTHKTVRKGGVYAFYGFGPVYTSLIASRPSAKEPAQTNPEPSDDDQDPDLVSKMSQPCVKNDTTLVSKMSQQNNPSTINNPSTKDKEKERVASDASPSPLPAGKKGRPNPDGYQIARTLAEVTRIDFDKNRARLMAEAKYYTLADIPTLRTAYGPGGTWYRTDWRGKRGELPNLASIRQTWGTLGLDGKGIGGPNRRGIEVS